MALAITRAGFYDRGMKTSNLTNFGIILVYLLALLGATGSVGWYAYLSALDQISEQGRVNLSLAADRVAGQLQRYRQVAYLMADHPVLVGVATGQADQVRAQHLLLNTADKVGAWEIALVGRDGLVMASSKAGQSVLSQVKGQAHFQRGLRGALGSLHEFRTEAGKRLFSFAAPVRSGNHVVAVLVAVLDVETIEESNWRGDQHTVFFSDAQGLVFIANRSELVLRKIGQTGPDGFAPDHTTRVGPHEIWDMSSGPYIPAHALHLTQPISVIGLKGEILLDTNPARRIAVLRAAVVAAVFVAFGMLLYWLAARRKVLAEKLEFEAETNAILEQRVEKRTEALRVAQAELVQAGKLAALGQMSAGISHELNQPLMAIQSFAENAEVFMARGDGATAQKNLIRIAELSQRMDRIIRNFRAFAKQENEPINDVDIVEVIEKVLDMSEARFAQGQIVVNWHPPTNRPIVRGGDVRLQQVIVNLVSNAIDAMDGQSEKRLDIWVDDGKTVIVHVRDNGPGISDPEKMFEPFYSTKEVGKSEGMGLGLSISYGLVQSFGGAIRGRNPEQGGAEFTVELTKAEQNR